MFENRTRSRRSRSSRPGARFWVSPECRKIACGMIVAPTMPTASVSAPASGSSRNSEAAPCGAPVDRRDEHFGEIAKHDRHDERADDDLDRAKPAAFGHQDAVGDDRRDGHAGHKRDVQQERQPDSGAEEFGEIGRHRRDLADDPERPNHRFRKMLAAQLGQIAPGDDAELGRQRLEQHRRHIRQQHHPQQRVAVSRAQPRCWWRSCRDPYRRSRRPLRGRRTETGCARSSWPARTLRMPSTVRSVIPIGAAPKLTRATASLIGLVSSVSRLICIMYPLLRHSQ